MKRLFLFSLLLICGNVFSASTQWGVWGLLSNFEGGTAYLVQAESTWTQGGIVDYLKENGLTKPNDSFLFVERPSLERKTLLPLWSGR